MRSRCTSGPAGSSRQMHRLMTRPPRMRHPSLPRRLRPQRRRRPKTWRQSPLRRRRSAVASPRRPRLVPPQIRSRRPAGSSSCNTRTSPVARSRRRHHPGRGSLHRRDGVRDPEAHRPHRYAHRHRHRPPLTPSSSSPAPPAGAFFMPRGRSPPMVATPLTVANPYIRLDKTKHYWGTTIATLASPSRAELDAMTDLSTNLEEAAGFTISGSTVSSQSFVGAALNLQGPKSVDDSSLRIRNSLTGTDARTIMTQDLAGYIVVFPEGDVSGRKMDVFQVIVNAVPKSPGIADPATTTFQFAVTAYALRVTVP